MKPQTLGKIGQDITQKYFENNGFCVIARNWHSRYGEIDLILRKCCKMRTAVSEKWNELIFCEVKTRAGSAERFGSGEEALDRRKREKILKTIFVYLEKNHEFAKTSWRLDLVCIKILLRNFSDRGKNVRKNFVCLDHYRNVSISD